MDSVIDGAEIAESGVPQINGLNDEGAEDATGTPLDNTAGINGSDHPIQDSENAIQQNVIDSTDGRLLMENDQRNPDLRAGAGNRFRGKPFSGPPPLRGRGGGPPPGNLFGRGAVRGGATGNFTGRNSGGFDPNWQNQNRDSNSGFNQNAPQGQPMSSGPPIELWVEAKTEDGKSYFYHAITRETTWNKPEAPNVKVMTQTEIEEMNKKQQAAIEANTAATAKAESGAVDSKELQKEASITSAAITAAPTLNNSTESQPPQQLQPPNTQQQQHQQQQQQQHQQMQQPPPNLAPPVTQQPPPALHQQPPPFFPPGMHPPNFSQPPFGMPPPGYGGYPPQQNPWGMPWNQHMHGGPPSQEKPAKNLIIKPGVIDPAVIARAAEWSEHRAPDGRPYYYHAGRSESVWEKPQAIRDMEAARMAAHSGATPQQATASMPQQVPHMMPNPLMHMPPSAGAPFDPSMAFNAAAVAAAAAASKALDNSKAAQAASLEKESKKNAEEKRKKEEEQKKSGNANKPIDKSRPISSVPIAGTPWCVVWTGDGRVFFYNPSTRTSVWERPEDLLDREDVDKAVTNPPEQLKNVVQAAVVQKEQPVVEPKVEVAAAAPAEEEQEDDEVIKIRTESESSVEEVPAKKSKLSGKLSKKSDANEAAVEAEVRAAKERALVPLETRVKQFKEMLREKDVSAFSTWEKELHKIVFDPRYLLLTSKERKQVFEKYVKDRAEEERKEKRNKMRQKRDDFRKLMEDAKLHGKSSFSDFCQRYGKEERYKAIEKVRERESLFNEYIVDVRRKEKEEKILKKEQIRKDFIEMLRERSDVDRHTRWHDIKKKFESDSRYRAVDSMYREEYFLDYIRIVKDEKRKVKEQKEREREREVKDEKHRKDKDRGRDRKLDRKDKERGRDRSRSRDRTDKDKDKERDKDKDKKEKEKDKDKEKDKNDEKKKEAAPNDGELHSASEDDEAERLQKEREKQLRAEQSIREREKEVQRTLAGHLRDRDKEREHHKRDEATRHFNALLTDLVRNPDHTWKEVKRQLRKDHRWELVELLDRDEREKVFNEHIDALMKKKREKFREMLDEINSLDLTSSWKDIKKLIKEDPRYLKYSNSDKCEREFRDYIKDKTINAKSALRELLQECKLISHKSSELIKDNPNHLKEIEDILKNDKRYLILNHLADERTTIIVNFLEELHKRGPPPPPTASESTRRNK